MESNKFGRAKNVAWLAAALLSAFGVSLARTAGRLEVKEEIAKAVEEKKAKDDRTFMVDGTDIDIDDI